MQLTIFRAPTTKALVQIEGSLAVSELEVRKPFSNNIKKAGVDAYSRSYTKIEAISHDKKAREFNDGISTRSSDGAHRYQSNVALQQYKKAIFGGILTH